MDTIIGLLGLAAFGFLIYGLIKPAILKWHEKPNRLYVVGYFIAAFTVIGLLTTFVVEDDDDIKLNIAPVAPADSAAIAEDKKQRLMDDSIQLRTSLKNELNKAITDINTPGYFDEYKADLNLISVQVLSFETYGKMANRALSNNDAEIKQLGEKLKSNLISVQLKEFPILRKKSAAFMAEKLWKDDCEVTLQGSGNNVINFIAGTFAANANKLEAHESIRELLTTLRFKKDCYLWYKYDDSGSCWILNGKKDSDL
jgi:hypothetical protein